MSDLSARAITLFGEIVVLAGRFEAEMGFTPYYVLVQPEQAKLIMDYLKRTKISPTSRARMVAGLELHIARQGGPLRVG